MHSFAWWPTVIVLGVATFTDLRSRRIPNWLVFPFLGCGIVVSGWLHGWHGVGAKSFRRRPGVVDIRISFLDGRDGRWRRKAVYRDWSVDRPISVVFGACAYWLGGRVDGARHSGLGRISEGVVPAHRRFGFQRQESRRSSFEQSTAAQDAVRTGDRDRDTDFVFRTLRTS